jgi:hypothetical protein
MVKDTPEFTRFSLVFFFSLSLTDEIPATMRELMLWA